MMDNSYRIVLTVLAVAAELDLASAGEYCSVYGDGVYNIRHTYKYCDDDCCGTSGNRYCCPAPVANLNIGAIVGGVIGGVFLLSFITAIIRICLKKSNRPGQVVQPAAADGPVTVMSTSYPQGGQQFQGGQPSYGYTGNHAYPPNHGANPNYPTPYPSNSGEQAPLPAEAPK